MLYGRCIFLAGWMVQQDKDIDVRVGIEFAASIAAYGDKGRAAWQRNQDGKLLQCLIANFAQPGQQGLGMRLSAILYDGRLALRQPNVAKLSKGTGGHNRKRCFNPLSQVPVLPAYLRRPSAPRSRYRSPERRVPTGLTGCGRA